MDVHTAPEGERSGRSAESVEEAADIIANLTLPSKLDTLKGDRAANQRLRKACYWLHASGNPDEVLKVAIVVTPRGELAKAALRRNLKIIQGLGRLTEENQAKMRRGNSPVITRGPYAEEKAEVDHIVPLAEAPTFTNWICNLEFMPRTLNRRKGGKLTPRAASHLEKLTEALQDQIAREIVEKSEFQTRFLRGTALEALQGEQDLIP